jgi:hypothetical protein
MLDPGCRMLDPEFNSFRHNTKPAAYPERLRAACRGRFRFIAFC